MPKAKHEISSILFTENTQMVLPYVYGFAVNFDLIHAFF